MARTVKFGKDELIKGGVSFIRTYGIEKLCVRDVAKFIGCSTQPIFKNYINFEDYKLDIKKEMYNDYKKFINTLINEEHYLFTISYAYALYSKNEKNIFNALFNTDLAGIRSIQDIKNASQNKKVIELARKEYSISIKDAEDLFIKTRFFTHGIAISISSGTLSIEETELKNLINDTIKNLQGGKL